MQFKTLNQALNSQAWGAWRESAESMMPIDDPERYDRIVEHAQNGEDGSTHAEHLSDIREFIGSLQIVDDEDLGEYPEPKREWILESDYAAIMVELDKAEASHTAAGTIDDIVG